MNAPRRFCFREHFQAKWIRFAVENAMNATTEHFQAKWIRFAVENAMNATTEHFQAKWIRFAVENASTVKARAVSVVTETARERGFYRAARFWITLPARW